MTLNSFFQPRGVVVVGASQDPAKLGYALARNLINSGYPGAIHLVSNRSGQVLGKTVYPSISAVPDPVDLAALLIPAPAVPGALIECADRGIRAVVILSGGFREIGEGGKELEAACQEIARERRMRLIGPNCVGVLDTHFPLDVTFLPPPGPTPGEVALVSQSGAMCDVVIDWAREQGFGLSQLISLGNQADVSEAEVFPVTASDPHTRVITLYLEGVSDGRRFIEAAEAAARRKPIIVQKAGKYTSGSKAAASHTGALAGADRAYEAAFEKAGVIRASSTEEMFDWARCLAWSPELKGERIAVLTNAGGPAVTSSDALEANGLELAKLTEETNRILSSMLPPAASIRNPVDMIASATPELYRECLSLLLADPNVDGVLLIIPPPPMFTSGDAARAVLPVIRESQKPVVAALMGGHAITEAVELFRQARVPEYRFPERAASALAVLHQRYLFLHQEKAARTPAGISDECREAVRAILSQQKAKEGWLSAGAARRVLETYGIPFLPEGSAASPEEAAAISSRIGFPVALKILSPDILHKSEMGGVVLGLKDAQDVEDGYHRMVSAVKAAAPQARIQGVLVQRMAPAGQEVIAGVVRDPQFGPLVMFGSGGMEVEGLKDTSFALGPLGEEEAARMLDRTWAGKKLRGYRSLAPSDRVAVIDSLIRLAQLAEDFPELREIEINPLRVMGKGAYALDVRVAVSCKL